MVSRLSLKDKRNGKSMKRYNTVEEYMEGKPERGEAMQLLRQHFLEIPQLEETLKWSAPTYVYKKGNLAGMAAFKSYVGIWFHQGA